MPRFDTAQLRELNPDGVYDSIELVPFVNWCIGRTGAPIGRVDEDTNGFFGVTARFGPRLNTVMIGFRHYGPVVAHRALDTYAMKHLVPYDINYQLVFDQRVHTYPYIVLQLPGLLRWLSALQEADKPRDFEEDTTLYTLPPLPKVDDQSDFLRPLSAQEFNAQASAIEQREAEREYPDPHDQPPQAFYPRRQYALSCQRLREALGVDGYRRNAREGWHVEARGRFAAVRLGGRFHTLDEVHYIFERYGIATTVAYGGYELSVDPDNAHNAPFRVS